jgi:hypothetical protein
VGRDHKLSQTGKIVAGGVGHDRIQGKESIGQAIRRWYGLKAGRDFERIDLDAVIDRDGHFILVPTAVTMRGAKRAQILEKVGSPLSFHHDYQSKFWKKQIETCRRVSATDVSWAGSQIRRVVAEHESVDIRNVHEADLLRAAGALSVFGIELSVYLTKGYDCPKSQFAFFGFPAYPCPIEIKKRSSRLDYQMVRYAELPRAVVLCVKHDLINPPENIDILELSALADYLHSK